MKQKIKLTESRLHNIIRRVIKEEVDPTVPTLTVDGWDPSLTWHPNKRILDRTRKLYDIYAAYEPDPNMAYFNRWLRDFGINVETL